MVLFGCGNRSATDENNTANKERASRREDTKEKGVVCVALTMLIKMMRHIMLHSHACAWYISLLQSTAPGRNSKKCFIY